MKRSGDAEPIMTSQFSTNSDFKQKRKSVNGRGTITSNRKDYRDAVSDYSPNPSLKSVVISSGPVQIQKPEENKEV